MRIAVKINGFERLLKVPDALDYFEKLSLMEYRDPEQQQEFYWLRGIFTGRTCWEDQCNSRGQPRLEAKEMGEWASAITEELMGNDKWGMPEWIDEEDESI